MTHYLITYPFYKILKNAPTMVGLISCIFFLGDMQYRVVTLFQMNSWFVNPVTYVQYNVLFIMFPRVCRKTFRHGG